MAIPRISRIDAVDPAVGLRDRALTGAERAAVNAEAASAPGSASKGAERVRREPAAIELDQLVLGSKDRPPRVSVPPENYAKIRYDQEAGRVLIQIVNAESGEVVREIPPEAWPRFGNASLTLPKGSLVAKEQ